jgi:hypothetical protein
MLIYTRSLIITPILDAFYDISSSWEWEIVGHKFSKSREGVDLLHLKMNLKGDNKWDNF